MAEAPAVRTSGLQGLSKHAVHISDRVDKLQGQSRQENTSTDIQHVATELVRLSQELTSLDAAIASSGNQYTTAFYEDLSDIEAHLRGVFEDIEDCCTEIEKVDGPRAGAVGWLHKKRYVNKLQKHLEAHKTTLVVMRTVLHHGKEYGMQNSPGRLAESVPHTLHEDRAILESIFASRNAIVDLRGLENKTHSQSSSTSSEAFSFHPGAHGRNLGVATGVDTPIVSDVLPISTKESKRKAQDAELTRRFSRRGVRLAVHSSILDNNAHEVPISLGKRWIHRARLRTNSHHNDPDLLSLGQLSRITEVASNESPEEASNEGTLPQKKTASHESDDSVENKEEKASIDGHFPSQAPSKAKKRSLSLLATPMGKSIGKVINRLSTTSPDDRPKFEHGTLPHTEEKRQSEKGPRNSWSYRFTKPFVKTDLTTPDFNKDVENMALR